MKFDFKKRTDTKIPDQPIGKLMTNLHMESAFFTHSDLSSPWSLAMPAMSNCMMFHLVVTGEAKFEVEGEGGQLNAGDFVLFPKGEGHIISDGSCLTATPLNELPIEQVTERYETLEFGGGGDKAELMCGVLLFHHPLAIKLLGVLPSKIYIDKNDNEASDVVKNISELIGSETQNMSTGAEAVLSRLAEILVITAMRQYLEKMEDDKLGWLGALEDDRIGKALDLIHNAPDKHWSLEELAQNVAMSRTSFAQQFKRLVGNTPIDYLTEWRMSLAYSKLQLSEDNVLSIALDLGYQSEASFSRAFKKIIGKSPGEVRKNVAV